MAGTLRALRRRQCLALGLGPWWRVAGRICWSSGIDKASGWGGQAETLYGKMIGSGIKACFQTAVMCNGNQVIKTILFFLIWANIVGLVVCKLLLSIDVPWAIFLVLAIAGMGIVLSDLPDAIEKFKQTKEE